MMLLQRLVKMRKAKNAFIMNIHDARLDCVLPSKRKQYANALALQTLVLSQNLPSQIRGAFFADSKAITSKWMIPMQIATLSANQQQNYIKKQGLDARAMYCFDVCYHLAFIRNLPQYKIIVERINRALHLGSQEVHVNIDSPLGPETRMSPTLNRIIKKEMDLVIGPRVYKQLQMQYGVDLHRLYVTICRQRKNHSDCHDPKVASGETQTINDVSSPDLSSTID